MIPEQHLEEKVIETYFLKNRKERFLGFISTQKNRWKFIQELCHMSDIDRELFLEIKGNKEGHILEALKRKGITNTSCYAISFSPEIDARRFSWDEARGEVIGTNMGTILVYGEGEIIYCEGEFPDSVLISK